MSCMNFPASLSCSICTFLGSTYYKRQLIIPQQYLDFFANIADSSFWSSTIIFILQLDISIVSDLYFANIYAIFRVDYWSYFMIKSSQTTRPVLLSLLMNSAFTTVVKWCSYNDDIACIALLNYCIESGVIVHHRYVL